MSEGIEYRSLPGGIQMKVENVSSILNNMTIKNDVPKSVSPNPSANIPIAATEPAPVVIPEPTPEPIPEKPKEAPKYRRSTEHPLYEDKKKDIVALIDRFKGNTMRSNKTFGGSEFATIIGENPNQTLEECIQRKVSGVSIGALPMWWGDLTEDYLRTYLELYWGTEIFELPMSIPSQYEAFTYSGDGAGVVLSPDGNVYRVLFEFKNPWQRTPKQGEVPAYYYPQPMSGMATVNFDIFECGIFVDALFRVCSTSQFGMNLQYSSSIHKFYKMPADATLIDMGFIGLYLNPARCTPQLHQAVADVRALAISEAPIIDLGAEPQLIFEGVLKLCDKNKPDNRIWYYNGPFVKYTLSTGKDYSLAAELEVFKSFCTQSGYQPIAYVPLKLLKLVIVPLAKDPHYIDRHARYLNHATNLLKAALKPLL